MMVVNKLLYKLLHSGIKSNSLRKFAKVGWVMVNAWKPETFSPTVFMEMMHIHTTGNKQTKITRPMKTCCIVVFRDPFVCFISITPYTSPCCLRTTNCTREISINTTIRIMLSAEAYPSLKVLKAY